MLEPAAVDWRSLIDDVLLRRLTDYAAGVPAVRTVYLTGSYVRGMWNPERPNVNVYFVVDPAHTDEVRSGLADVFSQVRAETRIRGADFLVDCHPFTISQRDQEWGSHPLLTLTTKVFDAARLPERLQRVTVYNKIDLAGRAPERHEEHDAHGDAVAISLSAKAGAGIELLRTELLRIAGWHQTEDVFIARERHLRALAAAQEHVAAARSVVEGRLPALELFAEELRLSQQALGEITGEFTADDLLGVIFSRFCIGK